MRSRLQTTAQEQFHWKCVASIALLMKMNGITTGKWTEIPAETLPVLQASPPSQVEAMLGIQEIVSISLSTTQSHEAQGLMPAMAAAHRQLCVLLRLGPMPFIVV
jgi:hypothetical protein